MPAAAVVGGVIAGGASIIGASKNAKAISKSTDASVAAQQYAADQQLQAARENIALQTQAYNQSAALQSQAYNSSGKVQSGIYNNNIGMLNPFVQTGYAASDRLNAMLGLPEQGGFTPKQVNFSPVSVAPIVAPETVAGATAAPQTAPTGTGPFGLPVTQTPTGVQVGSPFGGSVSIPTSRFNALLAR